ncbi:alpha/beta hydrolase [Sphaerisporangium sp. NPDC005288]|uniref:alpha/beta hydrolase n=1 Tax=Sphaerisporangium sp. NPDC005288 TaxID=3155114 RepID=UPI0033ABC9DD
MHRPFRGFTRLTRRWPALGFTLLTLLTLTSALLPATLAPPSAAAAAPPLTDATTARVPRVEAAVCPVPVPAGTQCGFLVVPERRDVGDSREIRVGYALHRSTAADRRPDPVVYTSGGPASASVQLTGYLTDMPLGRDRDVVVLEQRGSRWSRPRLDCPEIARALLDTLSMPGGPADPAERARMASGATACRDRLTRQGVDLRGYVTSEIAADVVDLRRALGYDQWNLFGVSYSTRSMLAAAEADPEGTRSVVLDSFFPPLTRRYDEAAADLAGSIASLGREWPGLSGRFATMVRRLNQRPAQVRTSDPLTGRPITVRLTGDDVATILDEAMHEVDVLPVVPALVDAVADGDDRPLQVLADQAGGGLVSHEFGLFYAVMCQDEALFNTFSGQGHPRLFTVEADKAVCDAWGLPASPSAVLTRGPAPTAPRRVVSAPVLVVGGEFDPTTPVAKARSAARALPGARVVEFAGVGHAVFLSSRCGRQTISAFVADPRAAAPCDPGRASYAISGPGDFHVTPVVYRVSTGAWWLLIPFALFLVTSFGQLVVGMRALVRQSAAGRVSSVVALTTVAGFTGVTFILLTAVGLYSAAASNQTALGIGVPSAVLWYGTVAALSAALSLVALLRSRLHWQTAVPVAAAVTLLLWWVLYL